MDHYLAALLLPKRAQAVVMAVRALNIEVAQVRDAVSEPGTATTRFRFWLDAAEGALKGQPLGHPVARALAAAGPGSGLRLSPLFVLRIIRARLNDDGHMPFATLADAEAYAEETASMPLYLTLEALGITSLDADHAASHLGIAQGLVTLLRGTPYWLQRRQVTESTHELRVREHAPPTPSAPTDAHPC